MSALLEKDAPTQAGMLYNVRRQLFQSVPPVPVDLRLDGKTVLVTGANVGLGLACARYFLQMGAARLVMAVRSVDKGEAAASPLRKDFPSAQIDVWPLDLARPSSVTAFAARCVADLGRLHVAVLNAGLGKEVFERTPEARKRETTLQVNYLSTALLALLLLPVLKPRDGSTEAGRLTLITSDAALGEKLPVVPPGKTLLDALDDPAVFQGFPQYAKTKLILCMFVAKLAADIVDPADVIVNTCNPGATKGTAFLTDIDSWVVKAVMNTLFAVLGRHPEDAARAFVHASLVLGAESHGSFTDWKVRCWPVALYSECGRKTMDQLWEETLEELGFAGVVDVLNAVKRK
ncbi:hypothetical protein SEUCBS139899_002899 [Sporothrix eucalyptigena]